MSISTQFRKLSHTPPELNVDKKACPLACRTASCTVEGAFIIPWCLAFWVAILFFFRVLQVETGVGQSLFYAGRKAAVEAASSENTYEPAVWAELHFFSSLAEHEEAERYITGGNQGVSLLSSDYSGDSILLCAEYEMEIPVPFFHLSAIRICQQIRQHKWVGKNAGRETEQGEEFVYITPEGSVYHLSETCRYLDLKIHRVSVGEIGSKRSKDGSIYYPCSCCGGAEITGEVYYTDYGTNYHRSVTCSGLKRTIQKVPISEAGDRPCCKGCGGG